MKQFDQNVTDVIGNTPIIKLQKIGKELESEIYVKLEFMNPGGSIKDRIGSYIVEQAVKRGDLKPGGTIIEGTSGNTGVGLAIYSAIHGYKCIFVMADKQSKEKVDTLKAFGAKVIVCPTEVDPKDPRSYYSVSARLAEATPNSFYVNQYDNFDNRDTHYYQTGPEIYEQTKGEFDVFMTGVGTGGTISGIGRYLKEKMDHVQIVGVDVEGSVLANYKKTGRIENYHSYLMEGLGEDMIPKNIDWDIIDDFVTIGDKEGFLMTRRILQEEGIYAGGSSGGAVCAAIKYAKSLKEPKKILVVLPDSANRYISKIFSDDWMASKGLLDYHHNIVIKDLLTKLNKKDKEFVSITESCCVEEAINLMNDNDVSQIPVVSKGEIIGVVTEKDLLNPLFEGGLALTDFVSVAYNQDFLIADEDQRLEEVYQSLVDKKIALVKRGDEIINVLTHIDILNFIARLDK
ncbi:MAG: pyridoxal-phosphate dependent enzyme [Bacteriovoracaceae bacterium]|jgi:cystathionine beta-synthase|nr:pyridoxal-phosphate dependent enzyme [Bacteriovoracaceae bacterium]